MAVAAQCCTQINADSLWLLQFFPTEFSIDHRWDLEAGNERRELKIWGNWLCVSAMCTLSCCGSWLQGASQALGKITWNSGILLWLWWISRAFCLESKNHPEDPLWGNHFHQHILVYAVASLIALALWHPKPNKDSRNPNFKLFYARWLWGWEQRDKALRGRGRAGVSSVGRDPETLLSVKILPNQQGLHPKCSPTNQQSFVSCNLYIGWLVLCQNYLQKVSCKLNLQQQP